MADTAICKLCNEEKPVESFHRVDGKVRKYICYPCRGKRERAQLKLEMLEAFGWKCNCCGESHPLFLTLEHKNRLGERATGLNSQQLYAQAKREGWPQDKYEMLCMSCNLASGHYGICPHRSGVTAEQALEKLRKEATLVARTYGPPTEAQKEALRLGPLSKRKADGIQSHP